MKKSRPARPTIRFWPAPLPLIGAVLGGLMLLAFAIAQGGRDGWAALVWAIPGVYILSLPVQGIVTGEGDDLRVGMRRIDLKSLQKVAVFDRKQWGLQFSVATLKFPDRVIEISGAFLSTKSFTALVRWLGRNPEQLDGYWPPRRIAAERPDLVPRHPGR